LRAAEFLSLAQSGTASGPLLIGHRLLASGMMQCGDYRKALPHAETAASLYRPEEHREFALRYSQDIGVSAIVYLSWALWHCGYPDQSATAAKRALEYSRQFGHAYTLAYALWHIGMNAIFSRQVAEAEACANEYAALADEHAVQLRPVTRRPELRSLARVSRELKLPVRGTITRFISGCSPRLSRLRARSTRASRSSTRLSQRQPPPARRARTQSFTACAAS